MIAEENGHPVPGGRALLGLRVGLGRVRLQSYSFTS